MSSLQLQISFLILVCFIQVSVGVEYLDIGLFSQFGGEYDDSAAEIIVNGDDIYIVGTTDSYIYETPIGSDVFIGHFARNLSLIYGTQLDSGSDDVAFSAIAPEGTGFVFVSLLYNNSAAVACYDTDLGTEWLVLPGTYNKGVIYHLGFDTVQYVLWGVGWSTQNFPGYGQPNHGGKDAWLVQMNATTGAVTGMYLLGTSKDEYFTAVAFSTQLGLAARLFAVGYTNNTKTSFVASFSTNTTIQLQNMIWINTTNSVFVADVEVVPSKTELVLVGQFTGTVTMNGQTYGLNETEALFVAKLNAANLNSTLWLTTYNSSLTQPVEMELKDDYGVILAKQNSNGHFEGVGSAGQNDILLVVINTTQGNHLDGSLYGTQEEDTPNGLSVISTDEVWVVGGTDGTIGVSSYGGSDAFIGDILTTKPSPSPPPKESQKKKGFAATAIAIAIPVAFCVIASVVAGVLLYRRRKMKARPVTNLAELNARVSTQYEEMSVIAKPPVDSVSSSGASLPSTDDVKKAKLLALQHDWMIDFDEIKIDKKIGQGAFGEVFQGRWRGIYVAVKQLTISGAEDKLKVQDFFAEAQLMKQLQPHTNITQLLGVCSSPTCIITEFIANGSLYAWLQSDKPMDNHTKMRIIKGTAAGMLHLHRQGVIHRDLAARNILLDKTMSPKVSDFGLSRVALDNVTNRTETTVGPIKWMAPEALIERTYNQKTDVWSFGVVIYEILTRESPYKNHNLMQIGASVAIGKLSLIPDLEPRAKEYPSEAVDIFKKCLQYSAKERPTFEEIVEWLDSQASFLK